MALVADPTDAGRADKRRNLQTLLRAAAAVFGRAGVDAPMRAIAVEANVGIGTLYRHFPTRADLIVAVFRSEVDACADAAAALAAAHPPGEALSLWIESYLRFIAAKRGMATALHGNDPAYAGLPVYVEERLLPAVGGLLAAAQTTGEVRDGIDPIDVLWAIPSLCASAREGDPGLGRRMVRLMVEGLRAGTAGVV